MKKALIILLALVCALALVSCKPAEAAEPEATTEPEQTGGMAGMPNPFTDVASYEELVAACPGVAVYEAPEGAKNVRYSYCATDGVVDFAQVDFGYGDDTYQYRAKAAASEPAADDMLHGYYYDFTADETVSETGALAYRLRTYNDEGIGVATWYNPAQQCQYALTTTTSQDPATVIKAVISNFTVTDVG